MKGPNSGLEDLWSLKREPYLCAFQLQEQAVGDKLDVLLHELSVHADEGAREGLGQELLLNLDSLPDDGLDVILRRLVD